MTTKIQWPIVLEVKGKPVNAEIIERQYRLLARKRHPDAGGSNEAMTELNLAKDAALKWITDQILAARQAEAARIAARQAEAAFHQSYAQQMAGTQNGAANSWGGLYGNLGGLTAAQMTAVQGYANAAAYSAIADVLKEAKKQEHEEKRKTKWQRVKEILRGER